MHSRPLGKTANPITQPPLSVHCPRDHVKTEKLVSPLQRQSFSPTDSYSDTMFCGGNVVSEYTVPTKSEGGGNMRFDETTRRSRLKSAGVIAAQMNNVSRA